MTIKTPKFWLKKNLISFLLLPLSFIYCGLFYLSRVFKKPNKMNIPIICVGNVVAGGSGKTPTAMAIGEILRKNKKEFAFLSRGYQGANQDVRVVDFEKCSANQVGDEPLLLCQKAPTIVSKDRFKGAKFIEELNKFKAIILDDGMQNLALQKDLTVMVIDGKIKFGNGFLIPAGPLRQSVKSGLKMSDLVVIVGKMDDDLKEILQNEIAAKKVVESEVRPVNLQEFAQQKLLAFCGLAYPEKFFSFLESQGLKIEEKKVFADHYSYKDKDLDALLERAKKIDTKLVTTKKDWVKFDDKYKNQIDYLDIELKFADEDLVEKKLLKILR